MDLCSGEDSAVPDHVAGDAGAVRPTENGVEVAGLGERPYLLTHVRCYHSQDSLTREQISKCSSYVTT